MKKITTSVALLLLVSVVLFSFSQIGVVNAESTIYIRADGSVEGTDKIHRDENLYTLTDNIYNSTISVLKDDVVIDGAGHILRGQPSGIGLFDRNNVTIKNLVISTTYTSDNINLYYCSNCTIMNNTITPFIELYPGTGVSVWGGTSNVIAGNRIMNNPCGIYLGEGTSNNSIFGNNITDNTCSMRIYGSQNTSIYHNNFINNNNIWISAISPGTSLVTHFDNGTTGNYWDNYNGTDNDGDGIGDTPHIIDENNQDNYPLAEPFIIPEFPSWMPVLVVLVVFSVAVAIYKSELLKSKSFEW